MVKPISEIRKPEIVQGAIGALNKHGLSMISYDLIAEEADMSRQLIRHYYPDPQLLMVAVCDALAAAHREALTVEIVNVEVDERLEFFLDFFFDALADKSSWKPKNHAAYDAMMSIATGSETVRKCLYEQHSLLQYTIAHEVRVSYPSLSQNACREIGYLFITLLYGHWRMVASLGFSDAHNQISRDAINRLIRSYMSADDTKSDATETNANVKA